MVLYTPTALEKGVRTLFMQTLATESDNLISRIATTTTSTSNFEKYVWLGESAQLEEFRDELKYDGITDTGYTIYNKVYAKGIAIRRTDLADDQTGSIEMRTKQLAVNAKRHPNKLLIDALKNGTSSTLGLGYDGSPFFSATHAARGSSGAQSNLQTGTGTSTAQISDDINAAIAKMGNLLAENAEPFSEELSKFVIIAPYGIRKPLKEALGATIVSSTSNISLNDEAFDVIFSARLTDVNDYYILNVGSPVRGLIFQDREALEFVAQDTEDSEAAFNREEYRYKARARYGVGYGPWQMAVKVTNT